MNWSPSRAASLKLVDGLSTLRVGQFFVHVREISEGKLTARQNPPGNRFVELQCFFRRQHLLFYFRHIAGLALRRKLLPHLRRKTGVAEETAVLLFTT